MNKLYKLFFALGIVFMTACQNKEVFSLEGKTNGIEDGKMLYLQLGNNAPIDSVIIKNNTFVFDTELKEFPTQVIIRTKNFEQYRFLWVEKAQMTFDATESDFRNALVTGSETETLSEELQKKIYSLANDPSKDTERKIIEQNFIKEHPSSMISSNMLSIYTSTWGKDKTRELFDLLSKENQNSKYGKEVSNYLSKAVEPKTGDQYVDFQMKNSKGDVVKLSDYKGKLVLLEFWASWCGPCRLENPNLVRTYEKYNPKGFEVLGVSLDNGKKFWLDAIEKDNLPWTQVSDLKGDKNEAAIIYGIAGIPDNFLIDGSGKIINRNLRGDTLNNRLEELLGK